MGFIEDLYYGNVEAQAYSPKFGAELKQKLNELTELEKQISDKLSGEEKDSCIGGCHLRTDNGFGHILTEAFGCRVVEIREQGTVANPIIKNATDLSIEGPGIASKKTQHREHIRQQQ